MQNTKYQIQSAIRIGVGVGIESESSGAYILIYKGNPHPKSTGKVYGLWIFSNMGHHTTTFNLQPTTYLLYPHPYPYPYELDYDSEAEIVHTIPTPTLTTQFQPTKLFTVSLRPRPHTPYTNNPLTTTK
jgi:hypothetical protein